MGGVESAKIPGNNYNCIHNVINQNDIVPWVGTTEMGFLRYGVDHFVPGSPETGEPGDGSDNNVIPEDNTAWNVGSGSYNSQRSKMQPSSRRSIPRSYSTTIFIPLPSTIS